MNPTLELLDPVAPLRRKVALVLLPLGGVMALLAHLASRQVGLDPVDRLFLPLFGLGYPALALLLWRRPEGARWVLPLAHLGIGLYLLATLGYQLLFRPNPMGLSPAAYWFPFLYFSAFLFFESKRAVRLGLAFFLAALALALFGNIRAYGPVHLNALAQFFGSNLAYLALLYLLVRIKESYLEARLDAYTDFLTGLRNRRYLEIALERELFRLQRYGRPVSLVVLDLDDFKQVNDTHGHDAGDRVLKGVAEVLEAHLRLSDRAVRLGGEEFALLLPETSLSQAKKVCERVREALEALNVPPVEGVRASFGVAQALPTDSPLSLLKRADAAMYAAKRKGKNRVEVG